MMLMLISTLHITQHMHESQNNYETRSNTKILSRRFLCVFDFAAEDYNMVQGVEDDQSTFRY